MKKKDSIEFDLRSTCTDYTTQFLATLSGFGYTLEDFQEKARANFKERYPDMQPSSIEAVIGYYLGPTMDQTKFIESLEILGGKVTVNIALEPKTRVGRGSDKAAIAQPTKLQKTSLVSDKHLDRPIVDLNLPVILRNRLGNNFIGQFGQLARMSKEQLIAAVGLGNHNVVLDAMCRHSLTLGMYTNGWKSYAEKRFDEPIENLGLEKPTIKALHTFGFEYIGQLVHMKVEDIKGLSGIGEVRRNRLLAALKRHALHLGMNLRGWEPPKK